jgi:hypothetical protein
MEAWVWIVVLIVFLLIVGVVIYFAMNTKPSPPAGTTSPPDTPPDTPPPVTPPPDPGGGNVNNGNPCKTDADCRSGNCSATWCQPAGIGTGAPTASCISSSTVPAAGGCRTGLTCVRGRGQAIGICTPGSTNFFNFCKLNTDCRAFNVCDISINTLVSTTQKYCVFDTNPNLCPLSTCLPGFECSDPGGGDCLGETGLTCSTDDQCQTSCGGDPGVMKWDGAKWENYGSAPSGVTFSRIVAVPTTSGDDIWGLDINNGLYQLSAGTSTFEQILPNTTSMVIDNSIQGGTNDPNPRTLTMTNFSATNDGTIYLLYSAPSTQTGVLTVYPIFTITNESTDLEPFMTKSGVQKAPFGHSFTNIIDLDTIISTDGSVNMVINGQETNGIPAAYYISGTKTDKFSISEISNGAVLTLISGNFLRYVPVPTLAAQDQAQNFQSLQPFSQIAPTIACATCSAYAGQENLLDFNNNESIQVPSIAISDLVIPLVTSSSRNYNNILFMAKSTTTGDFNLYIASGNHQSTTQPPVFGPVSILPGYYDTSSRIAASGSNVYVFSSQTCK